MVELQPIETAPKDGSIIVGFVPPFGRYKGYFIFCKWGAGYRNGWLTIINGEPVIYTPECGCCEDTFETVDPAFWMPLPEAPA